MTAQGSEALPFDFFRTVTSIVDSAVHAAVVSLRSALAEARTTTVSVLIDPILGNPLAGTNAANDALRLGSAVRHSLPRIHADLEPSIAPYLLHVADEVQAERCIAESIRVAMAERLGLCGDEYRGRSICAWVLGEADPSALAARLAMAARVVRPDGSRWPMRYWDPRVFQHLAWALQPLQHSALVARLGLWLWLDPTSGLLSTAGSAPHAAFPSNAAMTFDDPGWAKLSRLGIVNRVLDLAADWDIRPTSANAQRIDGLVQRCRSLGFPTEQDALVFSACALTSRDDFDGHPQVAAALRSGSARGSSAAQALEPFDDNFWAHLRLPQAAPSARSYKES